MKTIRAKLPAAVLTVCLCSGVAGCDALYRVLDKEGAEEKALVGDIVPHASNPVIEEAQALLYLYGYNTGNVDGLLGLRTRNAIEQFQKDNGLPPSRFLDKATWERLNVIKENGLVVERRLNVTMVQTLLKKAGFNPGDIDGKLGEKTGTAVINFQKSRGLKADGKIGYQTLSQLAQFITDIPQDKPQQ